ncbi:MAG: DUF2851 family protein [Muribaculaceae bacterium]|nr:DUF2851 family protein [Muribaculaceae bacterium]
MEQLMQYVWKHRLWHPSGMTTVDSRAVRIIDPGQLNTDAGPDFFNAKISIDGHVWAGDVEIHVRASDWHRHKHDGNKAYDSVILHVVDYDDTFITRTNGEVIPQMRMPCDPDFHHYFRTLIGRADIDLPCLSTIQAMPPMYITDWIDALAYERLYEKADRVEGLLKRLGGDWEGVCYVTLARALGFGINGDPFERLALSTPLRLIGKHSDSLIAVEALLFGQSGLLEMPQALTDSYACSLMREYKYLSHKFGLAQPESLGWKMSRMRPPNMPHRRIATLAAILHGGFRMLSRMLDITSVDMAEELLSVPLTGYWDSHYTFGAAAASSPTRMSRTSVTGLAINAIVPLMFAYGRTHDDQSMTDRAVSLLQALPPERNSVVELFNRAGIRTRDAFSTQAVIQLRRSYCQQRKCLYCRIGHRYLSASVPRT